MRLASQNGVATMGRLVFDEGSLTGKLTSETVFPEGDFRSRYFGGDRLARTVTRCTAFAYVEESAAPSVTKSPRYCWLRSQDEIQLAAGGDLVVGEPVVVAEPAS